MPRLLRVRVQLEEARPEAIAPVWLRLAVVAVGLCIGTAALALIARDGSSPFRTIWLGTFGSSIGLNQLIALGAPLILAGCAVSLGRRVGLWNIGVNGQMYMGAWLATTVVFALPHAPGLLLTIALILAGLVGGASWAAGPALLHAYWRVNEIFTTLLLNFIATSWALYFITTRWQDLSGNVFQVVSGPIPPQASLGSMQIGSITIGLGLALAIVVALALEIVLRYTRYGFRASLIGADEKVARYAGFSVKKIRIATFMLSGAIGGLAGVVIELEQRRVFAGDIAGNAGYIGIVVAVLAGRSLVGTIPMGILMAALVAMGASLQLAGVSSAAALGLTGLLLILASVSDALARYRLRLHHLDALDPESATVTDSVGPGGSP